MQVGIQSQQLASSEGPVLKVTHSVFLSDLHGRHGHGGPKGAH